MQKLILLILTICVISCRQKNGKEIVESDESQILNIAFDKVIGSDATSLSWLRNNRTPIPILPFSGKIDSVQYLRNIKWRDSVLKILDTASLYVVVHRQHADMVEYYVNNLLDTIKQKRGDTDFNGVLKILCDQNWSKDSTDIALLKPKPNFKILSQSVEHYDPIRKIGSIRFSKIALNKGKDTACVYTSFSCGEFCGKGDIHYLVKKGDKWIYRKKFILWSE